MSHCRITPLFNCHIVELPHCRITPLFNCHIVELSHCRIATLTITNLFCLTRLALSTLLFIAHSFCTKALFTYFRRLKFQFGHPARKQTIIFYNISNHKVKKTLLVTGILLIIILASTLYIRHWKSVNDLDQAVTDSLSMVNIPLPPPPARLYGFIEDSFNIERDRVGRNQNLASILLSYQVDYPVIHQLAQNSREVFDVRKIRAGNKYAVFSSILLNTCSNDTLSKWSVIFSFCAQPIPVDNSTIKKNKKGYFLFFIVLKIW